VDSGQLIGIIIAIIVVLAILAAAVVLGRKRKEGANRNRAVEMREQAKAEELGAKEREAKAMRAEADAKQAEVEAERLREEARGRQAEAADVRAGVQEQRRKADELDPDVVTTERGGKDDGEDMRRDRGARNPVDTEPGTRPAPDDHPHGDRPRNL